MRGRDARAGADDDDGMAAGADDGIAAAAGPFDNDGRLSHEMRSFVRDCFGPMLRAAMTQVHGSLTLTP